ncbi:hypothetical protein Godav_007111 [Gossypium davidsonii]|uniref:RING-type E3 ubiquitin transferase n=1 Tax=Gossypium davidsonii TaxID=34287 RepID=A0A7J8S5X8_GOSDV|nr:hypothetical protein [Gossypium davidsonii]
MDYSRDNVVHVIPNPIDPSVWATEEDYRAWNSEETFNDTPSNFSYDQRQPQSRSNSDMPPNKKSRNSQDLNSRSKAIGKMFFKTKLCCKFRAGTCPYIKNCNFAHSIEELRRPPPNWQEIVAAHEEEKGILAEPREEFHIPSLGSNSFSGETQSQRIESVAISLGPGGYGGGGGGGGGAASGGCGSGSNVKPSNWKTRICNKWELTGYCPFGNKCHFAHGVAELHRHGGALGDTEAKDSFVAPFDSKQAGGAPLKTPADTMAASIPSVPLSDLGVPSQRTYWISLVEWKEICKDAKNDGLGSRNVDFWRDNWVKEWGPLEDVCTQPEFIPDNHVSVSDMVSPCGDWNWDLFKSVLPSPVVLNISAYKPPPSHDMDDLLGWESLASLWNNQRNPSPPVDVASAAGENISNGLDPELIQAFPTFYYSTVKEFRREKYGLECAICLGEFEDEDMLRLLTICCHVFHKECVDLWLESHKTCPVCRGELDVLSKKSPLLIRSNSMHEISTNAESSANQSPVEDSVCIDIKDDNDEKVDGEDKVQVTSSTKEQQSRKTERMEIFSRSHSTGHSIGRAKEEDRYTLRLPEHIKIKIVRGHHAARSCTVFGEFTSPSNDRHRGSGEPSETRIGD